MAKAMQEKAGAKWGIQLLAGGVDSFQSMLPFGWSRGGELMNAEGTEWTLDSQEWVDALTYYQSFLHRWHRQPCAQHGAGAPESAFVDGSAPMMISGPYNIGNLEKAGGAGFAEKYAVATMPKEKSAPRSSVAPTSPCSRRARTGRRLEAGAVALRARDTGQVEQVDRRPAGRAGRLG
jgi:multiple sugar transport system substrate-binding protein